MFATTLENEKREDGTIKETHKCAARFCSYPSRYLLKVYGENFNFIICKSCLQEYVKVIDKRILSTEESIYGNKR